MKKVLLMLTVAFGLTTSWGHAQITFQKTFGGTLGDYAWSLQQTNDGSYLIFGQFSSSSFKFCLIKTNQNGDTIWTKLYRGTSDGHGYDLKQTSDGGLIMTGYSFNYAEGTYDAYVLKTDAAGGVLWSKYLGGKETDYSFSVQETTDGGYIILGQTFSYGPVDFYVIKLDHSGNVHWAKSLGGTDVECGKSIAQTPDGGYIVLGYTSSYGAGFTDILLMKITSIGGLAWSKTYGGTSPDFGNSILVTADGGYIIAGSTQSFGSGLDDAYVFKTDASGNIQWQKTYGGSNRDYANSIEKTNDGGYIICGYTKSFGAGKEDVYLIKIDSVGNVLWSKTYGGPESDFGNSAHQTFNGEYVIVGETASFGAGQEDMYFIKTDASGNSGCNETTPTTLVTVPTTIIINPEVQESVGVIARNAVTTAESGATESTLCATLGTHDLPNKETETIISPNPFSSETLLKYNIEFKTATLTIFNTLGQVVKVIPAISGQTIVLHRDNLPAGVYFICLTEDNKIFTMDKLIVIDN